MAGTLAIVVLILSFLMLASVAALVVLLRRGDAPRYSASRAYDASRREAVALLTGEAVESVSGDQWIARGSTNGIGSDRYRSTVAAALEAVVPEDRGLVIDDDGRASLTAESVEVVAALSTADLRATGFTAGETTSRLSIGLVLFNPEPPGENPDRVALPIQVLFPALRRAGRHDLVRQFEQLKDLVLDPSRS